MMKGEAMKQGMAVAGDSFEDYFNMMSTSAGIPATPDSPAQPNPMPFWKETYFTVQCNEER